MLAPWKENYDKPRQHIKKQRHDFANKGPIQNYGFPVVMYGCENWTIKKAEHQRIESLLDCKDTKPVHPKGNQSWILIGRTDAEAEAPDRGATSMEKTPMLGKIEGRRRRGAEEEMVGWHHWLWWIWIWANSRR